MEGAGRLTHRSSRENSRGILGVASRLRMCLTGSFSWGGGLSQPAVSQGLCPARGSRGPPLPAVLCLALTRSLLLTCLVPAGLLGLRYYYSRKVVLAYLDCALHTDMADIEQYYMKPPGEFAAPASASVPSLGSPGPLAAPPAGRQALGGGGGQPGLGGPGLLHPHDRAFGVREGSGRGLGVEQAGRGWRGENWVLVKQGPHRRTWSCPAPCEGRVLNVLSRPWAPVSRICSLCCAHDALSLALAEGLGVCCALQGLGLAWSAGDLVWQGQRASWWGEGSGWGSPRAGSLESWPLSEAEGLTPAPWPSVQGGTGSGLEGPAAPWGLFWSSRLTRRQAKS